MILLTIIAAVVLFTIRKPLTFVLLAVVALLFSGILYLMGFGHGLILKWPRTLGIVLGVIVSAVCLYVAW